MISTSKPLDTKPDKKVVEKIGRQFTMLFNRAVMYKMDHPFTAQSLMDFYKLLAGELKSLTPIVILMHQGQFFMDEEPLDSRLNTSKMLLHFKKGKVHSVSFERGLTELELNIFFRIFINQTRFKNADAMKKAFAGKGVIHARVNHVFFKKVTADEEVVNRENLPVGAVEEEGKGTRSFSGEMADFFKGSLQSSVESLRSSIQHLFSQPEEVSKFPLQKEAASSKVEGGTEAPGGGHMVGYLKKIRGDVESAAGEMDLDGFHALACSVMKMKHDLLSGIDAGKGGGRLYEDEKKIRSEADELTDQVIVRLIKEEYKQGSVSVERLAQVLRRLVPETGELNRLLPKLKEALLAEGMPLSDFLKLTSALDKELRSDEIAGAIKKSAEDMGVSGDQLVREITANPGDVAELIYLASEIRKGTGDEKVVSDLLVEYVERVASKIALDTAVSQGEEGGKRLRKIIEGVEGEIVSRLQRKDMGQEVMESVVEKLGERMELRLAKLESEWGMHRALLGNTLGGESTTFLNLFEEEEDNELTQIILKVRDSFDEKGLDENNPRHIFEEILKNRKTFKNGEISEKNKRKRAKLSKGILNRQNMLYFIEREISRALRYDTPFSTIMLSILKVVPQNKEGGGVKNRDILNGVLAELVSIVRDTDVVGGFDGRTGIVLLPMMKHDESHFALRRFLREIHNAVIKVNGWELKIRLGGAVTLFDPDETPDLKAYVKRAENDIFEMVQRLRNIQELF